MRKPLPRVRAFFTYSTTRSTEAISRSIAFTAAEALPAGPHKLLILQTGDNNQHSKMGAMQAQESYPEAMQAKGFAPLLPAIRTVAVPTLSHEEFSDNKKS